MLYLETGCVFCGFDALEAVELESMRLVSYLWRSTRDVDKLKDLYHEYVEPCVGYVLSNLSLHSVLLVSPRSCQSTAANMLKYMPQNNPTTEPTIIRLLTGTKVKFTSATKGQTFQLLIIRGITSLSTSLCTAFADLCLKAAMAATNAKVFTTAPKV